MKRSAAADWRGGGARVTLGSGSPPANRAGRGGDALLPQTWRLASASRVEAGFLFLLPGFGGVAFAAFAGLALGAGARVGFLPLAVFLFADAGVGQRAGAGVALIVGQRA